MNEFAVTRPRSSSVEDYLKAIWEVAGADVASTKDVADRLSISSASVTNMFARLQEMGLIEYERYYGSSLTEEGHTQVMRLVRRHRLIETFMLKHLGYSWEEVHEEAERLEHAVSNRFTERLAEFLGHPSHDPHGAPIPTVDGTLQLDYSHPLDDTRVGEQVRISQITNRDTSVLTYLGERGLVPGKLLEVKEVRDVDEVVVVEDENGTPHSLGKPLTISILVQSTSGSGD
jgi:DtxR family transcriptional regulator, Mn-dependent transcriptional regulator